MRSREEIESDMENFTNRTAMELILEVLLDIREMKTLKK